MVNYLKKRVNSIEVIKLFCCVYEQAATIPNSVTGFLSTRIVLLMFVGSVVKWLKRSAHYQYGLGSKHTRAILLCPWE